MRFSLTTLLLVSLWMAVGIGVWFNRQLWHKNSKPLSIQELKQIAPHWEEDEIYEIYSIDRRRIRLAEGIERRGWLELFELMKKDKSTGTWDPVVGFIDDSTCVVAVIPNDDALENIELRKDTRFYIWLRRFPERWWGHFYRPEVWALIVLTLVLAWRGVRHFRNFRATS